MDFKERIVRLVTLNTTLGLLKGMGDFSSEKCPSCSDGGNCPSLESIIGKLLIVSL